MQGRKKAFTFHVSLGNPAVEPGNQPKFETTGVNEATHQQTERAKRWAGVRAAPAPGP